MKTQPEKYDNSKIWGGRTVTYQMVPADMVSLSTILLKYVVYFKITKKGKKLKFGMILKVI
jgi:hypothetical protein